MNLSSISFPDDPYMQDLFNQFKSEDLLITSSNPFHSLVESIISQQLSVKAADTIYKRFLTLFPTTDVTPEQLAEVPLNSLRSVGMSWSKAQYIKNIAEAIIQKQFEWSDIDKKTDEEIIHLLTQIKGIGRWTAEMFLMFTLGRPDVVSIGDVGLQNAIQRVYKLDKKPTPKHIQDLSNKWKPYRTYACKVLWRSLDTTIKQMQETD
jgi:DNA-3-methyladenine glycosylase II